MKRHNSKEAYFQRLQQLAETKKISVKETQTRNLGTLIDYKRAADGVSYGIIKENHHYYIKKGGLKQDPNISDFTYIGGLANITNFQYKSLAEADKQRNMLFATINEAVTTKVSKTGSKKRLNEDKAGEEIDQAASKLGDLDAATASAEAPAELPADTGGEAEMAAGLEAEPAPEAGAEEVPADVPAPEAGAEEVPADVPAPEAGAEEVPAEEPAPDAGTEEVPAEEPEGGDAAAIGPEDEKSLTVKEIEKSLGKVTGKIRKTELEPAQVKSYVNSFLSAFKDKFDEVEIEDRKAMADKILKVVPDEEVEDLGADVPQDGAEEEMAEQQCAECGGFGKYAESRGYDSPQAFMECGEEEQGNVISGYANAHNDGMNDGDVKLVALLVNPEMLEKLKGEYGHEEYAEKLAPEVNALSEATEEDKMAQINELWGGLGSLGKAAWGGVKKAGQAVGGAVQKGAQAVGQAAQAGAQKVGQAATAIKQTYHAGEVPAELKKLEGIAADLGKQIAALNTRLQKAGQQPVNVGSILQSITNQVGRTGAATLGKYGVAAEGMADMANVPTQPNMLKEEDEPEEENGEGGEEKEKEIGFAADADVLGGGVVKPEGAPIETEEVGGEKEIEIKDSTVNITVNENHGLAMKGTGSPKGKGQPFVKEEKPSAGLSKEKKSNVVKAAKAGEDIGKPGKGFEDVAKKAAEKYGSKEKGEKVAAAAMWKNVKREGEEKEGEVVSEAEAKLRKYIRARLEEKVGLRKAKLTEGKKSPVLMKLDAAIDKQFKLYESVAKVKMNETMEEGKIGDFVGDMANKFNQSLEGRFRKQKELKAAIEADPTRPKSALSKAYALEIKYNAGLANFISKATHENALQVAQQAANDPKGLGKLSSQRGVLVYVPAGYDMK